MTTQWIRELSLTVESSTTAIELSNFRVKFEVRQGALQNPNTASIRVYNLSKATAEKIAGAKSEFKGLTLSAGYQGASGLIYKGSIVQSFNGRENPTDTFTQFFCQGGDRPYNWAYVNKTLKAGATPKDMFSVCYSAMKPFGITSAVIPDNFGGGLKYPRAISMFGMAKDYLRTLAQSNNCVWSIQNDVLHMMPKDGSYIEGGTIVLNSQTGLIGMPSETEGGIVFRALLNPRLAVNKTVQINQASIQKAELDYSLTDSAVNQRKNIEQLGTGDGTYRILAIDWTGDTRGQEWYADCICIGATTGITPDSQIARGNG